MEEAGDGGERTVGVHHFSLWNKKDQRKKKKVKENRETVLRES